MAQEIDVTKVKLEPKSLIYLLIGITILFVLMGWARSLSSKVTQTTGAISGAVLPD